MTQIVRFGIVGCGAIGPTHAAAIRDTVGARLVAVADGITDRADKVAGEFGVSSVYRTLEQLVADPDVDAVSLCTPSGDHAVGAIVAMNRGKHVLVEKPMDVSVEACDRMIAAAKLTGRKLGVVCQHRFDAASVRARDLIRSGAIGRLLLVTADVKWYRTQAYYDNGGWRGTWAGDGGGAVMNQGVHTVDLVRWLAGDVTTVYAQTRTAAHDRIEVEDVAVATLGFENGAIGSLVATTAAYDGLPVRIDLFGTDGSITIEGDRLKSVRLKNGENHTGEAAAGHAVAVAGGGTASVRSEASSRPESAEHGTTWGDSHRSQIEDFVDAIRHDRPPAITGDDGRAAVRLIRAIYDSARTGAAVKMS